MERDEATQTSQGELLALQHEVRRLRDEQSRLDARLNAFARHPATRLLLAAAATAARWRGWLGHQLLRSRLHSLYLKLARGAPDPGYVEWSDWERRRTAEGVRAPQPSANIRFSILMALHNPQPDWLCAAIDSVLAQSYPLWELCVCEDSTSVTSAADLVRERAAGYPEVRVTRLEEAQGISAALNRAAEMASGDFVLTLDQDDELSPDALRCLAAAARPGAALLYSDEELIDEHSRPLRPIFKPDWSPELLLSCMYVGHLAAFSRDCLVAAGGFRSEFDTAQDYDLALRVSESGGACIHIPRILYRWRTHPGSTAGQPEAKPAAHQIGKLAVESALRRRGIVAAVENGPAPATYRVRRNAAGGPLASIIVCSRKPELLERCLKGVARRTGYDNYELVVVEHHAGSDRRFHELAARYRYKVQRHYGPFDYSRMNNNAVRNAAGDVLLFLNDDVEPLDRGWLECLVAQAVRPEVGAAGALLFYPFGTIQHAGVVTGMAYGAGHPARNSFGARYWPWLELTRDVSAVTGACLAMRRSVFEELGGFDPGFPVNYNDVDLCLRARQAGYRVLMDSCATLRHAEAQTRIALTPYAERDLFWRRWGTLIEAGDPFYNPSLSLAVEEPSLRWEA